MLSNGQSCGGFVLDKKPKRLKAIPVIYANKPGRNRNIYPVDELKKAVSYYNKLVELDPTYKYCLIKHPKDESEEWAGLIAGAIDNLYYNSQKGRVEMDATLLPTIWGNFINWLIEHDYVIGTSIRGMAHPTPGVYRLGNKDIEVTYRSDLKLEGVDFVIYPSFITTNVSKENIREKTLINPQLDEQLNVNKSVNFERVFESYTKDLAKELDVPIDEVKQMVKNSKDSKEDSNMQENHDAELLELQAQKLKLEIENNDAKKTQLEQSINLLSTKKENLEKEIAKASDSIQAKTGIIKELDLLKTQFDKKTNEYNILEQKLKESTEGYQRVVEATKKAYKSAAVHCCGKFFDEQNQPKVRLVPIYEKVSDSSWGDVDKNALRKLMYLTQDKEMTSKVFGLVTDWDSWTSFKYPVYQPIKSKEDGYDVDLVLNKYGVSKALGYMQGRGFTALSRKDKKHLIDFLYQKYVDLQKAGLAEVPTSLDKMAKRYKVLEKIQLPKDDLASMVLESALLTSTLDIEGLEVLNKEEAIDLSDIDTTKILESAIDYGERVQESIDTSKLPKGDAAIQAIIMTGDQPSEFAKKYEISSVDDFVNKLNDLAEPEDVNLINFIKDAVYGYLGAVLDQPEDAQAVLTPIFESVISSLKPAPASTSNPAPAEGNKDATKSNEQTNLKKEDNEVFEQLKEYLEGQFDGVTVNTPEDAMELVKKLTTDYAEVYAELQKVQFDHIKEQKIQDLKALGIEDSVIDEELADISDQEELEKAANKIKDIFNKVKESTKRDSVDPLKLRKGVNHVEPTTTKSDDLFDKLMRNI